MENKQNIKDLIQKFYPHAKEKLGFDHPVRVIMRQDAENAQQSLGKTAYYDPAEKLIVLYVTDRHPKDVLRSFSHELVHHAQNCRGELDDLSTDAHYAKDGKGREIEEEAYLQGNLNLRDYEDSIKFEEPSHMNNIKEQNELEDIIDKLYDGPRDKKGVPTKKPPLKKNWKEDPIGRKQRTDFRKWYMKYGPGSKQKDAGAGMTSPEGPATDDPSFDYRTKLPPKDPHGLEKWKGKMRAMSRKEYKKTFMKTPEEDMKALIRAKDKDRMEDAIEIEKRLARLDPNAFRDIPGDGIDLESMRDYIEFKDSFSSKGPFGHWDENPRDYDYFNRMKKYAKHRTGTDSGLAKDALPKKKQNEGVNKVKLTKSQLKGLIEQTIEKITEKKFPDLTGDGKVTQADILKGRGVKLKEKENEKDGVLDDDGFDAFRDAFKPVTGGDAGDSEKEKNRERFRAVARAAERTKEKREEDGEMDEQGMVVKADVTLTGEAKRIIDMLDNFFNQADVESAEMEAFVAAIMQKMQDKGVQYADPSNTLNVDEISPVPTPIPHRDEKDDDLGEQEMKPTIRGKDKEIELEKEKKTGEEADALIKVATDQRKKEKETANPSLNVDENNETWYNSSLYESLKSKWTK
jgi:hypothetical protein